MEGGVLAGVWRRSPQPAEAGGLGAKPPAGGGKRVCPQLWAIFQ